MRTVLSVDGYSQYDQHVHPKFQPSACGPTTAYVITNYLFGKNAVNKSVDDFYRMLGGTKIGLFTWRFVRHMRRYLGPDWTVSTCSLDEALAEIEAGRPVALKFDKYFSCQFKKKPLYAYHWVPLIGFDNTNELKLFIHDNGGRNRQSRVRSFSYADNASVLTFVRITPNATAPLMNAHASR